MLNSVVQEWIWSANGQIGLWELADIIIGARKGEVYYFLHGVVFISPGSVDNFF